MSDITFATEGKTSFLKHESFYQVFRDISRSVHSSNTLREILDLVVIKLAKVLNAKGAFLRLLNEETGEFDVAAAHGMGERYLKKSPVPGEQIIADQGNPEKVNIITDILNAPRVEYPQEAWDEGVRMLLDIPLSLKGRMVGLIRIYLDHQREFSLEEQEFMTAVAEQCACAISKTRSYELQQAQYHHLALQTDKLSSLGRMAAGIAHEINNPLASILLFSSNIIKKVPEGSPVNRGLKVIVDETKRCKKIIEDLLEFSRDNKPAKALTDINTVIDRALTILENEFMLSHIQVEKDLADGLEALFIDENQMVQVFINLLINAVQAIGQHGIISVASWFHPETNMVKIQVHDSGCGIEKHHLERVFDPFFSTKRNGTGLGLSVTFGIVENHQGKIEIESRPRAGTLVTISLPAAGCQEKFMEE